MGSDVRTQLTARQDLIAMCVLGIVVLFVVVPKMVFFGNYDEIPRHMEYFRLSLALAVLCFVALALLVTSLAYRVAVIIAICLASYGLVVLLTDMAWPVDIGPLEYGDERVASQPLAAAVQLILFVAVAVALFFSPARLRAAISWPIAGVFLIASGSYVFSTQQYQGMSEKARRDADPAQYNIYHIVFDSYYGPWLSWSMQEIAFSPEELSGFIHYPNAFANYHSTISSYTSFMSGSMYTPERRIQAWEKAADNSSIVDDLHDRAFQSWGYALDERNGIRQISNLFTGDPGDLELVGPARAFDYVLLRVSPILIRHRVLDDDGAGPLMRYQVGKSDAPHGDIRTVVSYRQFQKFHEEEPLRPDKGQYVHLYLYPPHGPYQLNRDGEYVRESDYHEQLHLATGMLRQFVQLLKDLGRYDDSLIIVHSDHGSTAGARKKDFASPDMDFINIRADVSRQIKEVDVRRKTGRAVEARYRSLLLVKPCGAGGEESLMINDSLVQLLDLRDWIATQPQDVQCSAEYPTHEEISIHNGLVAQTTEGGRRLRVGRDILSGRINHYRVRRDGNWEVLEELQFEY